MLLKATWCGDVRLRVAQFLASLWQGSLHGRLWHEHRRHRPGSPRPQATGTSGALLSSDLDFEGTAQGNETKAGETVLGQVGDRTIEGPYDVAWLMP